MPRWDGYFSLGRGGDSCENFCPTIVCQSCAGIVLRAFGRAGGVFRREGSGLGCVQSEHHSCGWEVDASSAERSDLVQEVFRSASSCGFLGRVPQVGELRSNEGDSISVWLQCCVRICEHVRMSAWCL